MDAQKLQKKIMRRVYCTYCLRKATSKSACRLYMIAALAAVATPFVSFSNVFANIPRQTDPMYFYDFTMYAFMHTEFIVQLAFVGFGLVLAWILFDGLRRVRVNPALREA